MLSLVCEAARAIDVKAIIAGLLIIADDEYNLLCDVTELFMATLLSTREMEPKRQWTRRCALRNDRR